MRNLKRVTSLTILGLLLLGVVPAQASSCQDLYQVEGSFVIQRLQGMKNCFLSAAPEGAINFYRSVVLTDEGMFMVFNSYEFNKGTDGARVFFFFPRTRLPALTIENGQPILKTAAPNIEIKLHPSKALFSGMSGGVLQESPEVRPDNQGGVEISAMQTLWLDSGFRLKADPTSDMSRKSRFTDKNGKTCDLKNSEIFSPEENGDSYFHFNDVQLKIFLQKRCPELHVNW